MVFWCSHVSFLRPPRCLRFHPYSNLLAKSLKRRDICLPLRVFRNSSENSFAISSSRQSSHISLEYPVRNWRPHDSHQGSQPQKSCLMPFSEPTTVPHLLHRPAEKRSVIIIPLGPQLSIRPVAVFPSRSIFVNNLHNDRQRAQKKCPTFWEHIYTTPAN